MKIVYFGTPDFAVYPLKSLIENNYKIEAVVTVPDKPKGRGLKLSYSPVKEFALQHNLKILQPDNLKDESFINQLKSIQPDLFIVVAYRILPRAVYTIPTKGAFNLHGSLLPKYRGAAPIQWALINGDQITGLTTFFLEDKVDTGNIILQKEIIINPEDNFESLYNKMAIEGAKLVLETVEVIKNNKVILKKQDDTLATPAPKITKELCQIDWNKSALEIHNLIRGLSPTPGAFFTHNNKLYKILKSNVTDIKVSKDKIFIIDKNNFYIATKDFYLSVLEIKPENSKLLKVDEFIRGYAKNFT
ncbi:MAG TPA: methionyl-tRNA formyltransferase [Ignavibacteriales bacterium]|nr:methionyl-tRNA formyltransferase [Ignavibacteriales bacterium]HOL82108.1 methionyl-tRNA formyltransferase [Ignavibacteriales bacterium]HOM65086.1 methionyl-tRNA formyltransferase [Ignavibacteriales bacterium]HPD68215.1 methionyl-tRNA formyltransferase [Ignavibacteriales bacterium]HPP34330.1 methionyl-tRNA formyltransferase [Ignavibacteriales bacterium]